MSSKPVADDHPVVLTDLIASVTQDAVLMDMFLKAVKLRLNNTDSVRSRKTIIEETVSELVVPNCVIQLLSNTSTQLGHTAVSTIIEDFFALSAVSRFSF